MLARWIAFLTLFTLISCKAHKDKDLLTAALSMGTVNRALGTTQKVGATGAIAALSAAGSGLSTGAAAWVLPGKRMMLLASMMKPGSVKGRLRALALQRHRAPRLQAAKFLCGGLACDTVANGNYTMTSNEVCEDGSGTVTANSVPVTLYDDGSMIHYTTNGKFTYAGGCGTYSVDFENYPEYQLNTLSGSLKSVGTLTSTETETTNSLSGFFFANTQVTTTSADNFRVDGGSTAIVMDVRVDQSESLNILFDVNTDEIIAGIASGTISLFGTINGQAVDMDVSYVEPF